MDAWSPFRQMNTEKIARGDLRNAIRAKCQNIDCQHEWLAPAIGKCPKCGVDGAAPLGTQVCNYTRV
jgi:hypothetical protein